MVWYGRSEFENDYYDECGDAPDVKVIYRNSSDSSPSTKELEKLFDENTSWKKEMSEQEQLDIMDMVRLNKKYGHLTLLEIMRRLEELENKI